MINLTKIDQPFGSLDIETKLALHRAHYAGKVIEAKINNPDKWFADRDPSWAPTFFYRLQLEAMRDILCPWYALNTCWQWAARDLGGLVWVYTNKPTLSVSCWVPDMTSPVAWRGQRISGFLVGIDPGNKPWEESLVSRPEGV